jgi:hypothetical protein
MVELALGLLDLVALDEEHLEVFAAVAVFFNELVDFDDQRFAKQFIENPRDVLDGHTSECVFDAQSNRHVESDS